MFLDKVGIDMKASTMTSLAIRFFVVAMAVTRVLAQDGGGADECGGGTPNR
eukprot:CAMPEP_0171158570 /NCGR_PEP_ID=MMETSP0790-20130122/2575_1 /TAXON_ID=2925 /ORGANISM="Alexandrium catenella, Strain OF101" /LENGTH=50 /DNA_ID=CAMNT_0011623007 /DNA_START=141 /DNA_END=293 /DNA_ORIENTATION=-